MIKVDPGSLLDGQVGKVSVVVVMADVRDVLRAAERLKYRSRKSPDPPKIDSRKQKRRSQTRTAQRGGETSLVFKRWVGGDAATWCRVAKLLTRART